METLSDAFFIPFDASITDHSLPENFTYPFDYVPHPLCIVASEKLQRYLEQQNDWQHNFGLEEQEGAVIGKMFGVLVVKTKQHEMGFLMAFSGKMAGGNHLFKFVPPVYDALTEGSFLNIGMKELTRINEEIKVLVNSSPTGRSKDIEKLKKVRKSNSTALQEKLFDQYIFLNKYGKEKSLRELFRKDGNGRPPSGAGECAAPKLLQYAFQHSMQPIAMAEFWWGQSPKSDHWKHGEYYPACLEKCAPILAHMLEGLDIDIKPNR